jgi:hypothetical protein
VRVVVGLACACACGRIGFDGVAPPGDYVVSITQLVADGCCSFVDLDVDWSRSLAYVATRESGTCFETIDFATTPTIVARVGPPATSGDTCVGIALDAAGHLLVTTEAGNALERWDLGADPRAASYTRLAVATITGPRRISRDRSNADRFYVTLDRNAPGAVTVTTLASSPYLAAGASYASTTACPTSADESVDLSDGVLLYACSVDGSPVELVDDLTLALDTTLPAAPPSGPSGFWAAARTVDAHYGAMLGWIGVIVDGSTMPPKQLARFQNTSVYRGAMGVRTPAGVDQIWAAREDGALDVVSLANPAQPEIVADAPLGVFGAYQLRVSPDLSRAVVITSHGAFVVVDGTRLPATSMRWPGF